jgi:membrane protein
MDRIKALAERAKQALDRARERSALVDVVARTLKRFSADDAGFHAAALTYYTFFSIFPLLLLAGSILGFITFGNEKLQEELVGRGLDAAPLIRDILTPDGLKVLTDNRGQLAITGLILALYTGTGAIIALQHALNRMYGLEEEPGWVNKRLRALGWLAILGLAFLASVALSVAGNFAADFFGGSSVIGGAATFVAGILMSITIFATAYKVLPGISLRWRDVLPGALVGAAAFELLKVFGTAYLARGEATRNDTFGTLAAAATLLIAAYLVSQLTLLAAEVNLAVRDHRNRRQSTHDDRQEDNG